MSKTITCPKCGSTHVQISQEKKHGFIYFLFFGIFFIIWRFIKFIAGIFAFLLLDWWLAIIFKISKKNYVWKSKKLMTGKRKLCYCHDCGHNFKM